MNKWRWLKASIENSSELFKWPS